MKAKPEHRDRDETEVAILDALANRHEEGMSVFELRSRVDVDIDQLEGALGDLKADGLIEVTEESDRTVIVPEDHAIGPNGLDEADSLLDRLRRRLPL